MRKKTALNFLVGSCVGIQLVSEAARSFVDDQGTSYAFTDWVDASPVQVSINPNLSGVSHRSANVVMNDLTRSLPADFTFRLAYIYDPNGNEVWIGAAPDHFLRMGSKIIGITSSADVLCIKLSESVPNQTRGDELAEHFLHELSYNKLLAGRNGEIIDLRKIFGRDTLNPKLDARLIPKSTTLEGSVVNSPDVFTLQLKVVAANALLALTLSPTLETLGASINGRAIVLRGESVESKIPPDMSRWLFCRSMSVAGLSNGMTAFTAGRQYTGPMPPGHKSDIPGLLSNGQIEILSARALAVSPSGELWLGPSDCQMMFIQGTLVGAEIKDNELLLYAPREARLSTTRESIEVFSREVRDFERAVAARGYQCEPAVRRKVEELLPGGLNLPPGDEVTLRTVRVRDGKGYVITSSVRVDGKIPRDNYLQIVVDKDLQVVGTSIIDLATLRREGY